MPKLDPTAGAAKWANRTKAAVQDVVDGVKRTDKNPTAEAAKKLDKMRAKFNEAVDSGKVERGLKRVSKEDWQAAMINVGAGRIATGVDSKGKGKMEEFAQEFYPHLESGQREVEAMPDVTLEDGVNRAAAMIRHNAKFKRSR